MVSTKIHGIRKIPKQKGRKKKKKTRKTPLASAAPLDNRAAQPGKQVSS